MKCYWVNHVIEIKDCEKFFAYAADAMGSLKNSIGI